MLDKSAWKTADPQWMKHRERQWEGLEGLLQEKADFSDDGNPDEYMRHAREFFDGVRVDYPTDQAEQLDTPRWDVRVVLHPHPTVGVIRSLYREFVSIRGEPDPRYYHSFYGRIQGSWAPLIKEGVLSESLPENFMEAMYGSSFEEAVELWGIDAKKTAASSANRLMSHWFNYVLTTKDEDCDYVPYDRLLDQLFGMLPWIDDEDFKVIEFRVKKLFNKILPRFDQGESARIPKRRECAYEFCARIKAMRNELTPKFWPYIDSLG